ncbi:hypothetical protein PBY51_010881 [Eleginops maclovinus]|uniref:Uncharacterized protein n=1 Tax=Eleginops maclovinus TaxID=56733 RepID=A0AAN8AF57_ELEMC|nr:hypothetical protein PBY51_010881 [Eleginops maclovinus]
MEEEEQLRPFMFLMTYMLLKRRRDLNNANTQRRSEIQRRIRHRQYFLQRQRRMLMMMMAGVCTRMSKSAHVPGPPPQALIGGSGW